MLGLVSISDIGKTIEEYIKANLIPSWVSFVVQFSALIILVIVFLLVGYKPVKKLLAKRADYVENNIRDSEKAKAEAQINFSASEERVISSKKEAAEIIANAKLMACVFAVPGAPSKAMKRIAFTFLEGEDTRVRQFPIASETAKRRDAEMKLTG